MMTDDIKYLLFFFSENNIKKLYLHLYHSKQNEKLNLVVFAIHHRIVLFAEKFAEFLGEIFFFYIFRSCLNVVTDPHIYRQFLMSNKFANAKILTQ